MDDGTPEPRRCEVCGDPIRRHNKYGICTNGSKSACAEARRRMQPKGESTSRSTDEMAGEPRRCDICGCRLNRNNAFGVCDGKGKPACQRERSRRRRGGVPDADRAPAVTVGQVFGKWTALETCAFENQYVMCRCECGTERQVRGRRLVLGQSTDCGCEWAQARADARFPDVYLHAGYVAGRLTLLEDARRSLDEPLCRCECGREKRVRASCLKFGKSKSCGCVKREQRSTRGGFSKHPLYPCWDGIVGRCTDQKDPSYGNYGGRGITVCERWLTDPWGFASDIERQIGPRPDGTYPNGRALYSLDRIDNDGGYWCGECPDCIRGGRPFNVQWNTTCGQVINQRKVRRLTEERDALAAEVERLTQLLASRSLDATPVS